MTSSLHRPHPSVQPAGKSGRGWVVRIPAETKVSSFKPSHFAMLFVLESLCRGKSYTWASNATLARMSGLGPRQVQNILREMEAARIIYRLAAEPGRPGSLRAGIFLHRRLDPDRPVEDRPPPPEAVARLWAARERACAGGAKDP